MEQHFLSQTALDQMAGSDTTQFLKASVPYLPPKAQQFFAIYAKTRELSNTLHLFAKTNRENQMCASSLPCNDPLEALEDIRRFCYGESRNHLDQMINILAFFQILQLINSDSTL